MFSVWRWPGPRRCPSAQHQDVYQEALEVFSLVDATATPFGRAFEVAERASHAVGKLATF